MIEEGDLIKIKQIVRVSENDRSNDPLNDYLDEQARLRHLEQSWAPTGQEM